MRTTKIALLGAVTGAIAIACSSAPADDPAADTNNALSSPPSQGAYIGTLLAKTGNGNCAIIVPDAPLTAAGLATPYQLFGRGCSEADANTQAFVEATILDPATGHLSVYHPLVINRGTTPAVAPVVPTLPANAVVGLWFGYNGGTLILADNNIGQVLAASKCVNGLPDDPFGQVSFCNASTFFAAANKSIAAGLTVVPPIGTGLDGQPCITTRSFAMVDQDQSDNVVTKYLLTTGGQLAQNTAANVAKLAGATLVVNGSDNASTSRYDKAIGCHPFTVPSLDDPGVMVTSQALDELIAAARQPAPIATVPILDPMTLTNGQPDLAKVNAYRAGVDQAPYASLADAQAAMKAYCSNLITVGVPRLKLDQTYLTATASPDPAVATNFFTFLCQRWEFTWGPNGLGCAASTGLASPITSTTDANGVTNGCTIR